MRSYDELARITRDPAIRRRAMRRAGSRELAEDALQETYWNVAKKSPETVDDLRAYYITAVVHEIDHQRVRSGPFPVADITSAVEQDPVSGLRNPHDSVERQVAMRQMADTVLERLKNDRAELMAAVPRRSPDQRLYRTGIVVAARAIFLLLVEGYVASADWNAVLRSTYASWFAEDGLAADATDQRLSRGRYDVRMLLQSLVTRDELG